MEITASSEEQSVGVSQVNQAIEQLDKVSQQNAAHRKSWQQLLKKCLHKRSNFKKQLVFLLWKEKIRIKSKIIIKTTLCRAH